MPKHHRALTNTLALESYAYRQDQMACWDWPGYHDPDTGRPVHGGQYVYRVLFRKLRGLIPPGMDCHHVCENPRCVNPWHLEVLTREEHGRRHRKDHCRHGHPKEPAYTSCRTCTKIRAALKYQERKVLKYKQPKEVA